MTANISAYLWDWSCEQHVDLLELAQRLPQSEQIKLEKMKSVKARLEHLTGRVLLRHILHTEFSLPFDINISVSQLGKPFVENGPEFNISHSRGVTFLGVSCVGAIGVDVEHSLKKRDVFEIARAFGRPEEIEYMQSLGSIERRDAFYKTWSLKESFSKAKGRGLDQKLKNIFFDLKTNEVFILDEELVKEGNVENFYQFYYFNRDDKHFSICHQDKDAKVNRIYSNAAEAGFPLTMVRSAEWLHI